MNRKHFLSAFIASAVYLPTLKSYGYTPQSFSSTRSKTPPFLKSGSTIAITSPAGYITLEQINSSILTMQSWGLTVKIGETIGKRDYTYGGTDEERLKDFQDLLDDPTVDAIMCARGGYGFVRIIDRLDFTKFKKKPKWIIGFSDITVILCHLDRNFSIPSIHSKMCSSFPDSWENADPLQKDTILSIKQVLFGEQTTYTAPINIFNRFGKTQAKLIGGNLSILETLAGSESDIHCNGKILFIEDTGEALYSIDRMMWNLKRSGKLDHLKGLIVGGFKMPKDNDSNEFGKSIYEIIMEKIVDFNFPVAFDFPVGHQKDNYALKCGSSYTLEVFEQGSRLQST